MRALCVAICYHGCAKGSDFIDELVRQLQKPINKSPQAVGDADIHRVVKEMIKAETCSGQLQFSKVVANLLFKDLQKTLDSRAVFVLIELAENEKTKKLVAE